MYSTDKHCRNLTMRHHFRHIPAPGYISFLHMRWEVPQSHLYMLMSIINVTVIPGWSHSQP